jgi:hypothetical protein
MRRNTTWPANRRERARDEQEHDAKLMAVASGVNEDILGADLFVRLPLQQVAPNRASFDLLLYNYFGAVGFVPEEQRVDSQKEGQFVKYGGLNGIEVGTITVRDLVYLAARRLTTPLDSRTEKAMVWLERVMAVAKQAANHLFERNGLSADRDLRAVLAYRKPQGNLHIEECSWAAALEQQSKMAGVDYRIMHPDDLLAWMQRLDSSETSGDISDEGWGIGERLAKSGVEEVAVMFDGEGYHFADADAFGTPSHAEYITGLWKHKYQGFVMVGAHELVEAEERLPEWLIPQERAEVLERVNRSLVPMFYGARFHPELSGLAERFSQANADEVYETFFREVNDGKIRLQLEQTTGRIMIDREDAYQKLSAIFEGRRADQQALETSFEAQEKKGRGIRV